MGTDNFWPPLVECYGPKTILEKLGRVCQIVCSVGDCVSKFEVIGV